MRIEPELRAVTEAIVRHLDALRVVLFGSYAEGNADEDSDIDLLIVVEDSHQPLHERNLEVRRLVAQELSCARVSPLVYTEEELEARIKLRDFLVLNILRKGKTLFKRTASRQLDFALRASLFEEAKHLMNPELAKEWFAEGDRDAQAAQLLYDEGFHSRTICFHLHQCLEKYLKGVLIFHDEEPPRIHDLGQLIARAGKYMPELLDYANKMDRITEYYLSSRYPSRGRAEYSREEASEALRLARRIVDLIQERTSL